FTVISFAKKTPMEATQQLNDLAGKGWEYMASVGPELVAFKRRLRAPENEIEVKNIDSEVVDRLNHIDSRLRYLSKITWVDPMGVNRGNRQSRIYARGQRSVPASELDRSFGAVTELKDKSMLSVLARLTLLVPEGEQAEIEKARQIVLELRSHRL